MRSKYRPNPPTRLRRTPLVEQLESRFLLSCNDVLGCVRFEFVEPSTSQTLTQLEVGNEAVLQVYIQDLRDDPGGFGQGYLDIAFNSNLAAVSGEIDHGSLYTFGRSGDTSTPGLIDAAGGSVSNVPSPPGDEHLLFSVPVLPASTGTFELMPSLDQDPNNQFQFFDVIGPVTDLGFCDTSIPIVDGDLGQVIVDPTSGLTTSESGDTDTFTVVLGRAPMSSVTINLSSSDTSEGTVEGSGVLTFNASNWSTPQEVTIRGVDDQRVDGNVDYTIITSAASSSDPAYSGLEVANVSVTNLDDADQAGFLVDPLSGLTVQESGSSQVASLQLTSQPESNVTVEISLSDTSEASLDRSNFTFTPGNWNVPQQLTVTGRDDAVDDGDVMFEVRFNTVTTDPNYTGLTPPPISAVNLDDDTAGITLNVTDATTDESGDTAEFSLVLDSEPTSSVSIPLTSTDPSEGTLSTSQVTFTTANWNVPQTVVVTGQPDNLVDGDVSYMIVTGEATSADPLYRINPSDVSLTNLDVAPDTLITVSPLSGLITDEAGRQASFTVVLEAEPAAEVTLPIASSDPSEGTLSVSQLLFNSGNWNQPQTVFVTGQDDDVADGDVNYSIQIGPTSSDDDAFDNLNPPDVSVTNRDLDVPGLVLANTDNLQTSESGVTDSFTVRLNTQPTGTVTLPITISDPTEGRVDPSSLVFTPTNWNQPQTIDLFGVDDEIDDGDVGYSVMVGPATSGDGDYDGAVESVPVVNLDDSDTAGFALTPLGPQVTNEGGLQAQFSLTLTSEPLSEVELPILSNDVSEGTIDLSNVSFLPSNWDVPQVITVTGVNDDVDDDDVSFGIRVGAPVSDDAAFADLPSQTLNFVNVDDDQAGLIVTPTAGLITGEDPTGPMPTDEVMVRLASEPVATVTVNVSSSDASEGAVSPTVLSFDASNWDQFQTVTVSGVDDMQPDGDVGYDVILATTSSDPKYAAFSTSVDAVNVDDDVPGIVVDPTAVITSEDGTSVDVSFRLRTPPSADVSFSLMSNDETEGIPSVTSLTFTPTNWNIPQLVTITPQNDDVADGPVVFAIVTSAASSADPEYDQLEVPDVAVQNNDDDVAGVRATRIAGDRTGEDGTTVTYEVVLTSEPLAEVIVNTTSDDPGEGSVSTNALTFDAEDWNVPQTIVVTGEDDPFVDGDRPFAIQLRPSSQDPTYNDLATESLSIFNVDDDSASLVLQVMQPTVTEGTGSPANGFDATVTLIGAVEGGFQLSVQTEDGTASAADMDFVTPTAPLLFEGTAEETQQFTISIGPDDKVEFDETFNLSLGDLIGLDPSAAANITVDRTPVVLTILNDDEATLAVNAVSLNEGTGDTPTSFVFEVTLSNPVQGGFQVDYETADDTATTADNDYAAASGVLSFAGTRDEVQTVTVAVTADAVVERNEAFLLTINDPTDFEGEPNRNVSIEGERTVPGTIVNDDFATIEFAEPASLALEQDGTHTVSVVLQIPANGTLSEPLTVNINDLGTGTATPNVDYTLVTNTVTFPAGSGDGATQPVRVEIVTDQVLEDIETIQLALAAEVALARADIGPAALMIGSTAFHQVEIVDDPMTGNLAGFVWDDEDRDGFFDSGEMGIPDVTVTLSGVDVFQNPISRTAITDANGSYQFNGLPIGFYEIVETQPNGFDDSDDYVGTVAGVPTGTLGDDRISEIVLGPAQTGVDYNFTEREELQLSKRQFLASVAVPDSAEPADFNPTTSDGGTTRLDRLRRLNTPSPIVAPAAIVAPASSVTQTVADTAPPQAAAAATPASPPTLTSLRAATATEPVASPAATVTPTAPAAPVAPAPLLERRSLLARSQPVNHDPPDIHAASTAPVEREAERAAPMRRTRRTIPRDAGAEEVSRVATPTSLEADVEVNAPLLPVNAAAAAAAPTPSKEEARLPRRTRSVESSGVAFSLTTPVHQETRDKDAHVDLLDQLFAVERPAWR